MNKRQRDTILATLREIELSQTDIEVAEFGGNGCITAKIYELLRSIQAMTEIPGEAGSIKQRYNLIIQWAVCGINNANRMEALNETAGKRKDS